MDIGYVLPPNELSINVDIREQLRRQLPVWLQPLLTMMSGVPHLDEQVSQCTQAGRLALGVGNLLVGTAVSTGALALFGWDGAVVLPLTWSLTVSSARYLQLVIYHHASHDNLISRRVSRLVGRVISLVLVIQPFEAYRRGHNKDHHGRNYLSTTIDPTVRFLVALLGLKPGLPVEELVRRFRRGLVSPAVHARLLRNRLVSPFTEGDALDRAGTVIYLGGGVALTAITGLWLPVLVGIVLPLTIGYQTAAIVRLVVEHHWPASPPTGSRRTADEAVELTYNVMCVNPPPPDGTRPKIAWYLGNISNAIVRLVALVGDSGPAHAEHHDRPRGRWENYGSEIRRLRQNAITAGRPLHEMWGFRAALRASLESFAKASPASLQPPISRADLKEVV